MLTCEYLTQSDFFHQVEVFEDICLLFTRDNLSNLLFFEAKVTRLKLLKMSGNERALNGQSTKKTVDAFKQFSTDLRS